MGPLMGPGIEVLREDVGTLEAAVDFHDLGQRVLVLALEVVLGFNQSQRVPLMSLPVFSSAICCSWRRTSPLSVKPATSGASTAAATAIHGLAGTNDSALTSLLMGDADARNLSIKFSA